MSQWVSLSRASDTDWPLKEPFIEADPSFRGRSLHCQNKRLFLVAEGIFAINRVKGVIDLAFIIINIVTEASFVHCYALK